MSIHRDRPLVGIIGAGVSGLSCGTWLARLGYDVRIWSKDLPEDLVSRKAGAVWFPFQANPRAQIERLSMETYNDLNVLADKHPDSGVTMVSATLLYRDLLSQTDFDFIRDLQPKPIPAAQLPDGFVKGWKVDLPFIDTTVYMPFLTKAFLNAGGHILAQHLQSIDDVAHSVDLLINCSGLGARELFDDREVYPIRGQTIAVEKWCENAFFMDQTDDDNPGYIFTRRNDCLLGGTVEPNQADATPSETIHDEILARCTAMAPAAAKARVLSKSVGFRPGRTQLRLQRETSSNGGPAIFHNYGHGGSGFTISWGCARQIVNWVQETIAAPTPANTPF